jgi:lipopolysaccharide transport system permease protein
MRTFSHSPREYVASLWTNRALIKALVIRDVVGRYRGSVIGVMWSLFQPLLMLLVYSFVFSVVFKSRWEGGTSSRLEFALVLFAGLIVFNLFSECINRAPNLVLANVNYVKKVIFPLEILPWVTLGAAGFHALVSLGVWLVFYVFVYGVPHLTSLWLPIVLLPLVFGVMGLCWFLASFGVYLRDVGQFTLVVTSVLMFLSPLFYPVSALPPTFQQAMHLNPLTPTIEAVRDVLVWGHMPNLHMLVPHLLISSLFSWLGFAWFQKTRKGFADVL